MKFFQSDRGTKFVNQHVRTLLIENGTHHRLSYAHTTQQNGQAERKHRLIAKIGLTMLFNTSSHDSLWFDTFSSATYIINHRPSKILYYKSPLELLYHSIQNYNAFKALRCLVFLIYVTTLPTSWHDEESHAF